MLKLKRRIQSAKKIIDTKNNEVLKHWVALNVVNQIKYEDISTPFGIDNCINKSENYNNDVDALQLNLFSCWITPNWNVHTEKIKALTSFISIKTRTKYPNNLHF